jgi:hypothetical protein
MNLGVKVRKVMQPKTYNTEFLNLFTQPRHSVLTKLYTKDLGHLKEKHVENVCIALQFWHIHSI